MIIEPVRKSITVNTTPERAFNVFRQGSWWPKEHSILASGSPQREIVIEPKVGGRWYEIGEDNSECVWGQIIVWDPPRRMVLGWQINGNFEIDRSATTEVEVNFIPEEGGTRVDWSIAALSAIPPRGRICTMPLTRTGAGAACLENLRPWRRIVPLRRRGAILSASLLRHERLSCRTCRKRRGRRWAGTLVTGRVCWARSGCSFSDRWATRRVCGGLGVLKAGDEAEARKIAEADPALHSGLGFECEVYPMLQAVVPS